jgi:hypothetical protein
MHLFCEWRGIGEGLIDVLVIHSAGKLDNALLIADMFLEYCKGFGVELYIAHNSVLQSADEIMN